MTTASLINQALIKFQFAWNELEWTSPYPPDSRKAKAASAETSPNPDLPAIRTTTNPPNPNNNSEIHPVAQRINLARDFCFEILDLVGKETSVWTDELKQRVAQMASQFPPHHR